MTVEWHAAFVKAQAEFPPIGKGQKATIPTKSGGSYDYTYASLPDVLDAVREVLAKNGFAVAQSVEGRRTVDRRCDSYLPQGRPRRNVRPARSGLRLANAVGAGSAITYARRYALPLRWGSPRTRTTTELGLLRYVGRSRHLSLLDMKWRRWVWDESAVFKAWTEAERKAAAAAGMERLGVNEFQNQNEARAVLEEMRVAYEGRTDGLPLDV